MREGRRGRCGDGEAGAVSLGPQAARACHGAGWRQAAALVGQAGTSLPLAFLRGAAVGRAGSGRRGPVFRQGWGGVLLGTLPCGPPRQQGPAELGASLMPGREGTRFVSVFAAASRGGEVREESHARRKAFPRLWGDLLGGGGGVGGSRSFQDRREKRAVFLRIVSPAKQSGAPSYPTPSTVKFLLVKPRFGPGQPGDSLHRHGTV